MKKCELCSHIARMCCQSDNASLCYDCDQNVHSANFLVAKHSRTLLCHNCQSPTPWTASGLHLGRAATVCVDCLDERQLLLGSLTSRRGNHVGEENRDVHEEDGETDGDDSESSDESENDDEDAENQVVPWSSVVSPPVTDSSTGNEFSSSRISSDGFRSASKRQRLDPYIDSEDDAQCSLEKSNSRRSTAIDGESISLRCFRPLKVIR